MDGSRYYPGMVKTDFPPAPIEWTTKPFQADFYLLYDPKLGGKFISWGYTDHQLAVWCFCYDPSNDAETADVWVDDDGFGVARNERICRLPDHSLRNVCELEGPMDIKRRSSGR